MSQPKVLEWLEKLEKDECSIPEIQIDNHIMFGPNLGFLSLNCKLYNKNNKLLPGCITIRGKADVCLLLLEEELPKTFMSILLYLCMGLFTYFITTPPRYSVVVVKQLRIGALGKVIEAIAGMATDGINSKLNCVKEVKEETGIQIESTEIPNNNNPHQKNVLKSLGDFFPSVGGSDERIRNRVFIKSMSLEQINSLNNKNICNQEDNGVNEVIEVGIMPFTLKNVVQTRDSKIMTATMQLLAMCPNFLQPKSFLTRVVEVYSMLVSSPKTILV